MNLRKKSRLIVLMIIVPTILISLFSGLLMVERTHEIENDTVSKELEKSVKLINHEISNLDSITVDWAFWNDTYYFAIDKNKEYINNNLMDDTFFTLRINFFVIKDANGKIIYKKAFDLTENKEIDFPQSLEDILSNSELLSILDPDNSIKGIIDTKESAVILASQPILKSDSTGLIAGTLILGRFVDSKLISDLSDISPNPINLYRIGSPESDSVLENPSPDLQKNKMGYSKVISDSKIRGYHILKDIYERPGILLEIEVPRDLYMASKKGNISFLLTMLGFSLLFGIAFILALEKGILSKIYTIEKEVKEISTTNDYSSRLKIQGDDEIDSLASKINEMIENIQKSSNVLRESEEKYRTLFEESMDAIWATNLDGEIIDANEAAAKLLDIPIHDLIGSNIIEFYESPEERVEFQRKVEEMGSVKEYPLNLKTKKGERIYSLISFTPWRDNKGNIMGYRGLVHNVTTRKLYEKQLIELNETLRILNKILRHDILNDLTIVLTAIDLMQETDERLKQKALKAINKSINLIERMRELEQALISGSHVEKYQLNEVIKEVTKDYKEIQFNINGNCEIGTDDAIFSVFDNIIRNAVIHGKTDRVDVSVKDKKNICQIIISDYGTGITDDIKDNIFDEGSSFGESRGSGLGLFIVKKVIERYGGSITVEDNKPCGSTFIIKLKKL